MIALALIEVTTRRERLTFVADNAKGDKDAPSYFGGIKLVCIKKMQFRRQMIKDAPSYFGGILVFSIIIQDIHRLRLF